jgi:hypothetical protein
VLRLTQAELRMLVRAAGLLAVRASSLLTWAGTVNPTEATLPRWRRPYVTEFLLLRYGASLDVRGLKMARELAGGFAIDVERHLIARAFHWLRRIRDVRLGDPRWKPLEVPAACVPWRLGSGGDGPELF